MAIPNRSQDPSSEAMRVDSDAISRPQPILKLVGAPETGSGFAGVDSRGRSIAAPGIASGIAVAHHGVLQSPSRHTSDAYFATIRRGEVQKIQRQFSSLGEQATRDDFAVCFHPIVNAIRKLLDRIADARSEGNTREILRRLRDTFLDGGWARYRDASARRAAEEIIDFLAGAEGVTPQDVKWMSSLLRAKGLRSTGIPVFDLEGEDNDVEEEEEVSD